MEMRERAISKRMMAVERYATNRFSSSISVFYKQFCKERWEILRGDLYLMIASKLRGGRDDNFILVRPCSSLIF